MSNCLVPSLRLNDRLEIVNHPTHDVILCHYWIFERHYVKRRMRLYLQGLAHDLSEEWYLVYDVADIMMAHWKRLTDEEYDVIKLVLDREAKLHRILHG